MSLIVDINPVPWEILELVKARILKNRAKRQPQEQLGELKRAMSLRPGPLSRKRREEEPSFVGQSNTPYFAFLISGNPRLIEIKTTVKPGYENAPPGELQLYDYEYIYEQPGSVRFKLGEVVLGDIVPPTAANTWIAYLFIWSGNDEAAKNLVNNEKTFVSGKYFVPEFTRLPQPPTGRDIPAVFDWIINIIDKNKLSEPGPGDRLKLEFVPLASSKSISESNNINFCSGYYENNKPVFSVFGSDMKKPKTSIIEYPMDPDQNPIFWPSDHVFSN